MPFKRISINQGRQPHTLLKGPVSGWRPARGDRAGREEEEEAPTVLTLRGAERPALMRLEVLC